MNAIAHVDQFPAEWRDLIRMHLAGACDDDSCKSHQCYITRGFLTHRMHARIETYDHGYHNINVKNFPAMLSDDGSFKYTDINTYKRVYSDDLPTYCDVKLNNLGITFEYAYQGCLHRTIGPAMIDCPVVIWTRDASSYRVKYAASTGREDCKHYALRYMHITVA